MGHALRSRDNARRRPRWRCFVINWLLVCRPGGQPRPARPVRSSVYRWSKPVYISQAALARGGIWRRRAASVSVFVYRLFCSLALTCLPHALTVSRLCCHCVDCCYLPELTVVTTGSERQRYALIEKSKLISKCKHFSVKISSTSTSPLSCLPSTWPCRGFCRHVALSVFTFYSEMSLSFLNSLRFSNIRLIKQAVGGRPPRYAPAPFLPVGAEAPCAAEQTAT